MRWSEEESYGFIEIPIWYLRNTQIAYSLLIKVSVKDNTGRLDCYMIVLNNRKL